MLQRTVVLSAATFTALCSVMGVNITSPHAPRCNTCKIISPECPPGQFWSASLQRCLITRNDDKPDVPGYREPVLLHNHTSKTDILQLPTYREPMALHNQTGKTQVLTELPSYRDPVLLPNTTTEPDRLPKLPRSEVLPKPRESVLLANKTSQPETLPKLPRPEVLPKPGIKNITYYRHRSM